MGIIGRLELPGFSAIAVLLPPPLFISLSMDNEYYLSRASFFPLCNYAVIPQNKSKEHCRFSLVWFFKWSKQQCLLILPPKHSTVQNSPSSLGEVGKLSLKPNSTSGLINSNQNFFFSL